MFNHQYSRRDLLRRTACGFGGLALSHLAAGRALAENPLAPRAAPAAARAKRVIFLFMAGGPSHVDSFDPKPELTRRDGQSIDFVGVRFGTKGKLTQRQLMAPMWKFRQYGQSGTAVSQLFPEIAQHADDLCFLHGMQTEGVAHGPATLFLHTGATNLVRPSVGSWLTYGLGSENENLPGFVTIGPSPVNGGPRNYSSAFLPAVYGGTPIGRAGQPLTNTPIPHTSRDDRSAISQAHMVEQLQQLNRLQTGGQHFDPFEATIDSYELAFRMQSTVPELFDLSNESEHVQRMYGIGEKATAGFGRQCLLARRLAEAGVRYIQVNYTDNSSNPRWDQHNNMRQHEQHALATDRPVAALLADLKQRGLLDDTLVWWGGEFGRTPFSQNGDGRDHNPRGFTVWLAGGGVKAGYHHGSTDEIGHLAVDGKVHMHDLHATLLHLMGIDHQQLTFRHSGRDFRLTDVHGRVVEQILA
jgi:hypothetical protein